MSSAHPPASDCALHSLGSGVLCLWCAAARLSWCTCWLCQVAGLASDWPARRACERASASDGGWWLLQGPQRSGPSLWTCSQQAASRGQGVTAWGHRPRPGWSVSSKMHPRPSAQQWRGQCRHTDKLSRLEEKFKAAAIAPTHLSCSTATQTWGQLKRCILATSSAPLPLL